MSPKFQALSPCIGCGRTVVKTDNGLPGTAAKRKCVFGNTQIENAQDDFALHRRIVLQAGKPLRWMVWRCAVCSIKPSARSPDRAIEL